MYLVFIYIHTQGYESDTKYYEPFLTKPSTHYILHITALWLTSDNSRLTFFNFQLFLTDDLIKHLKRQPLSLRI